MKKILVILGSIFLVLVVLGAVGIGIVAFKGKALDQESRDYVDDAVPAIISTWDKQELASRASPEFMQAVSESDLEKLFAQFRRLGKFQSYDGSQGESNMSVTNQGKVISALYTAKATFDNGPAVFKVSLIKHDGDWRIMGFRVDSKVFLDR